MQSAPRPALFVPYGQSVQARGEEGSTRVLGGQEALEGKQDVAPERLTWGAAQLKQDDSLSLPTKSENLPAGQGLMLPSPEQKKPTGQGVQEDAPAAL